MVKVGIFTILNSLFTILSGVNDDGCEYSNEFVIFCYQRGYPFFWDNAGLHE